MKGSFYLRERLMDTMFFSPWVVLFLCKILERPLTFFVESALGTMNPSSTISAIAENVELITF
jgi:hypothetical protein